MGLVLLQDTARALLRPLPGLRVAHLPPDLRGEYPMVHLRVRLGVHRTILPKDLRQDHLLDLLLALLDVVLLRVPLVLQGPQAPQVRQVVAIHLHHLLLYLLKVLRRCCRITTTS